MLLLHRGNPKHVFIIFVTIGLLPFILFQFYMNKQLPVTGQYYQLFVNFIRSN
jgi:hypothetical protein